MKHARLPSLALLLTVLFFCRAPSAEAIAFTDVTGADWFCESVTALSELGIVSGYSDGSFRPQTNVTNAEALKLVMGAAGIAPDASPPGSDWATGFLSKASVLGLIDESSFSTSAYAARIQVADMLVKALNLPLAPVPKGCFADTSDPRAEALKELGIMTGQTNGDGSTEFRPDSPITRAEICTLILRADSYRTSGAKDAEQTDTDPSSTILTEPITLDERTITTQPLTQDEFEHIFMYMAYTSQFTYTIDYSMSYDKLRKSGATANLSNAFTARYNACPEYFAMFNSLEYRIGGTDSGSSLTITLYNKSCKGKELNEKFTAYIQAAEDALAQMIGDGTLTADMTQTQKAKAVYGWVCQYADYGLNTYDGYNAYGFMKDKTAVCQGYTAIYNLLCRYLGITVQGVVGTDSATSNVEDHIWTAQILDGVRVMTDATWGDLGNGQYTLDYFARSAKQFSRDHVWDRSSYKEWNNAPGLDGQ